MTSQFETAQRDYCAAVVRGGARSCLVFSPSTFSPSGRYLILLPFGSFSHYDEGTYTSKGLTPEQAQELSSRRTPTIAANHESAIEYEADDSFTGADTGALLLITEVRVNPGTGGLFLKLVRDFELPAARKAGVLSFEVYRTVVGESPDRFFIVRRLRNFAELDQIDSIRASMPVPRRYAYDAMLSKCAKSVEISVMRSRPDLGAEGR